MQCWLVVLAVGLALFTQTIDMGVTNVALPTLGAVFEAPPSQLQWIVLAGSLPFAALILPLVRWAEGIDRRVAFVGATLGYAGATALCGLAPTFSWLIGGQLVQGLCSTMLATLTSALVATAVPERQRGRAFGLIVALGPVGFVVGPAVGGWLLTTFGSRAIFFINAPVGALAALIGWWSIAGGGAVSLPQRGWIVEAVLLGGATVGLFQALTRVAENAGADALSLALFGGSLVGIALWRRRPESAAFVELLAAPAFTLAVGALILLAVAGAGATYLLPFFLQRGLGLSPAEVGLILPVGSLTMAVTSPVGGYLADRWGTRTTTVAGTIVVLVSVALLLPLDPAWTPTDVAWRWGLTGVGMGLFLGPNTSAIMSLAPRQMVVTASGLSSLANSLGLSLGLALITVAWAVAGGNAGTSTAGMVIPLVAAAAGLLVLALGWALGHRRVETSEGASSLERLA